MWDEKHAANELAGSSDEVNSLAIDAEGYILEGGSILEIGCGVGKDARYFANRGYSVTATDFSEVVIVQNRSLYGDDDVHYTYLDVTDLSGIESESWDAVYANLSLHYFGDAQTRAIFDQITRILRPNGILAFACKAIDDRYYGLGEMIEENYFNYKGHLRHFFSYEYIDSILDDGYERLFTGGESIELYTDNEFSSIISCVAKKK